MDAQRWLILAVVVIVVAVIVSRRSVQTRDRREQARRITVQAQSQAHSPAEAISQREDRRLAGMSEDDRAWEQASLQRHRVSQQRTRTVEVPANLETHG
jgi:hypothetical protein